MKGRYPVWARALGGAILVVSFCYVFLAIRRQWGAFASLTLTGEGVLAIVLTSLAYGSMLFLLGCSWGFAIRACGADVPLRVAAGATMFTQIGRYIPGGVMHFVGRHVLLAQRGYSHSVLVKAAGIDVALMCLTSIAVGTMLGAATLPRDVWMGSTARLVQVFGSGMPAALGAAAAVLSAAAFGMVALRWRRRLPWAVDDIRKLAPAVGLYFMFFVLQACLFWIVYRVLVAPPPLAMGALFTFAWLAGVLTIGAPGGLGVREAVLILLGASLAPQDDILLAALLFRGISIAGDLVAYGLGAALLRSEAASPAPVS